MFMKTKYKVHQKFHNIKNCLFFSVILIRIQSEVQLLGVCDLIQKLDAMYWNFIILAPMMVFIMRQRIFGEKHYFAILLDLLLSRIIMKGWM